MFSSGWGRAVPAVHVKMCAHQSSLTLIDVPPQLHCTSLILCLYVVCIVPGVCDICVCVLAQEYLSDSVCNLSTEEAVQVCFHLYTHSDLGVDLCPY